MLKIKEKTLIPIPQEVIMSKIFIVRGEKIILDEHISELYGVQTKVLNQAVRRNILRFPAEFMFQLTKDEYDSLRSHFVTLKKGRGTHRKYLPYVFTEPGVAMLSSVLRTKKAIEVNIQIVKTFVRLRHIISENVELAKEIDKVKKQLKTHESAIIKLIEQMSIKETESKRKIGFVT